MTLDASLRAVAPERAPERTRHAAPVRSPQRGVARFWFKACPRCEGDLVYSADIDESYISCMQCGHYLNTS